MQPKAAAAQSDITVLLKAWTSGDETALDKLTPKVYNELRRIARRYMSRENAGNTLQPTALVNEVYLKLVDNRNVTFNDRAHFFAVAAQMMRRILVDAARAKAAEKRGGKARKLDHSSAFDFDQIPHPAAGRAEELAALDEALRALAALSERKAKVVELRFFGGLSVEETAEVLKISPQSVMRDWKLARSWLARELGVEPARADAD